MMICGPTSGDDPDARDVLAVAQRVCLKCLARGLTAGDRSQKAEAGGDMRFV